MQATRVFFEDFRGAHAPPLVASRQGRWAKADTSSAGSPTVQCTSDGLALTLDNTNEVQNICAYFGDVLSFDIDDLVRFEVVAKVSDSLAASVTAVLGLGSARNDDPDALAANALFKLAGSNALLCESDDGTNDKDDIATGLTLGSTFKRLAIDFKTGVQSVSPPGISKGGKGSLQFFASDANNVLRRVAQNTLFDMSNYSSGLQPIFQIQKTAAIVVPVLTIREVTVEYRLPY